MSAPCSPERWRELNERWRNQCIVARWLGEQAVTLIRRELAQAWEAGRVTSRQPAPSSPVVEVPTGDAPVVAPATTQEPGAVEPSAVEPFDGYDTLPANHIVQRLRRMNAAELVGAGAYEAAHRNRSTVLGMVEQLLTTAPAG